MGRQRTERVLALWAIGQKQADIAREVGISPQRVHQIVRARDTFFAASMKPVVWERQGGRCADCHLQMRVVDGRLHHVIALKSGGVDEPENLAFLCQPCHSRAHANEPPSDGTRKLAELYHSIHPRARAQVKA